MDPPAFPVGVVPLGFKRGELRLSFGNFAKYHFTERKDAQSVVTQDADVELPSLDILFSQRFLVHALVNELNALLESFIGLDERALGNADRTFFPERFDEQREFQSLRSFNGRSRRQNSKVRHANLVIGQQLLRHAFVFAQRQPRGTRSRVGHIHHFEQACDVAVVSRHFVKMLSEIEDDIGRVVLDLVDDHARFVPNADRSHLVPELPERPDDVGFGCPVVGFQFGAEVLIRRRRPGRVEEHQYFVLVFRRRHLALGILELTSQSVVRR